jgi:hypothetical protein
MKSLVQKKSFRSPGLQRDRHQIVCTLINSLVTHAVVTPDLWAFKGDERELAEFLQVEGRESELVHPLVLGAAIESCGHFVTALKFYESIANTSDQETSSAARFRWLHVKKRQIDDRPIDNPERRQYQSDRARRLKEWQIADRNLEKIPNVPNVKNILEAKSRSAHSRTERTTVDFRLPGQVGSISWKLQDQWMTIEWNEEDDFSSIRIDLKKQVILPQALVTANPGGFEASVGRALVQVDFDRSHLTISSSQELIAKGNLPRVH